MNRREWLEVLGATGVAVSLPGACANAGEDHAAADPAVDGFMGPIRAGMAHFCGIHIAKNNPSFQLVAQHYCVGQGEQVHQCLLYDSCDKNAKLLGVEYIVSDKIFQGLPAEEKKYWHPHAYEVMAGGLIAPSMKPEDELGFMKYIINTWGKTWHTWPDPTTPVPMGEPLLMWSVGGDGQLDPAIVAKRDGKFGVSTAKVREDRIKAFGYEVPNVSLPKSQGDIGRQWNDSGDDKPTSKKSTP